MIVKNKVIKLISMILIVMVIVPTVLFSRPKQAHAVLPVSDFLGHLFAGISGASTASNTGLHIKDFAIEVLKEVARGIAQRVLQKLTQGIVGWINSGFHGSPLFLTNPDSFFKDVAKSEIKSLVDLTGYDPNRFPFGKQFALNTIESYKRQFADNAQYSLSRVINDPTLLNNYRNNFNYGGWNGFLINTQYPQNNYLGYNILATQQLASKLQGTTQNAAQKIQTTLNQGMGFLSPQSCPTNPNYNNGVNEFQKPSLEQANADYIKANPFPDIDCSGQQAVVNSCKASGENANQNPLCSTAFANLAQCLSKQGVAKTDWQNRNDAAIAAWSDPKGPNVCPGGLVNTTPGSVAANRIMTALGSDINTTGLRAAVGGSIAAILDSLVNHFVGQGLTELGGVVNSAPSIDNWSFNGSTLGGTNTVSSTVGALVIPQNVSVTIGDATSTTMSGGTPDYFIQTPPNAAVATAQISGSTLTITGNAPGSTTVTVRDSSTTPKTVTISITINAQGALVAIPQNISANVDDTVTTTISGGTAPYAMITSSDKTIAVSTFSSPTLVINGIKRGNTTVVIQDSSVPAKTSTIPVTIIGPTDLVVPPTASINAGEVSNITISGGTIPYVIDIQALDPAIAKVDLSGSTLTITGVSSGETGIIVKDSSSPEQIASVDITVTGVAGGLVSVPLGDCVLTGTSSSGILSHNVTADICTSSFGGTFVANLPNINGIPLGSCEEPNGAIESNIATNVCSSVRGNWTANQ